MSRDDRTGFSRRAFLAAFAAIPFSDVTIDGRGLVYRGTPLQPSTPAAAGPIHWENLIGGTFTIRLGDLTTTPLPYDATLDDVNAAICALFRTPRAAT